jgi:solute carrier family 66 (lysosomal lysine-arginine transporter), member 1
VPTVIALAIYFCIADFVLISQCLYYNHINARRAKRHLSIASRLSEDEPLLSRARSNDTIGLPGSRRRSSARRPSHASELRRDSLSKILEEDDGPNGKVWLRNTISILLVCIAGAAGWFFAYQSGVWTPTPEGSEQEDPEKKVAVGAEILGYFSALCYLGYVILLSNRDIY